MSEEDRERAAFEAWETYLAREKWVYGMPGLYARPAFIAGWNAAHSTASTGADDERANAAAELAEEIKAAVTELSAGAKYPDLLDAIDRLRDMAVAAVAAQQEPVAYGLLKQDGTLDYDLVGSKVDCEFWASAKDEEQYGWPIVALYLTAPAAPAPSADDERAIAEKVVRMCAKLLQPLNDPSDWTKYAKHRAECAAAILEHFGLKEQA